MVRQNLRLILRNLAVKDARDIVYREEAASVSLAPRQPAACDLCCAAFTKSAPALAGV